MSMGNCRGKPTYRFKYFPDLEVDALSKLAPTEWFTGELVLTGIRYVI
jgi:hypothetical protein